MNVFSLSGKVVVITGGSKGIGKSISKNFAAQGAQVHILDLDQMSLERTVQEIRKSGGKANSDVINVASRQEVYSVMDAIYEQYNCLNILVNNAGIAHIGNLEETSEEDFDKVFAVNVKGVFHCSSAAVAKMRHNNGGVILNVASIAANLGISDRFAYSASKGAILAMTYSIAKDFLKDHIRCNAISPARVHTPFVDGYLRQNYPGKEKEMFAQLSATQPIGRMGKPDEVAHLALYLCSDEAAFITGANYLIDGGFTKLNS